MYWAEKKHAQEKALINLERGISGLGCAALCSPTSKWRLNKVLNAGVPINVAHVFSKIFFPMTLLFSE